MGFFQRLKQSLADTYHLDPRYYRITTAVGVVGVAVGLSGMIFLMYLSSAALGLPLESASSEGWRFVAWIALLLVSIPFVFYLSMVLVAGVFGLAMVALGRFSLAQARDYAIYSEYPPHWFEPPPG